MVTLAQLRPKFRTLELHRLLRADSAARHDNFERLSAYHRLRARDAEADLLDERTWSDLDFDQVFLAVDHARSEPGRQCLYAKLRAPRLDTGNLEHLESAIAAVEGNEEILKGIREATGRLSDRRAARLIDLFFTEIPKRPFFWWVFPLLTAIAAAAVLGVWFWPRAIVIIVAVSLINLFIQVAYKPRVEAFIPAIHELPAFLASAAVLGRIEHPALAPETSTLRRASELRSLRGATTWLKFEPDQSNEIASALYGYVNLLMLLDVNAFVLATERIRSEQPTLRKLFHALGELDVVQSVISWRQQQEHWVRPEFTPPVKRLDVDDVVHPLLPEPVANSIIVDGTSILVTGSNMSGKTTFIRTLGVNAVLAQTLNTVCATRWEAPFFRVRSSIGRSDSLMEGKSYYLAEAESILSLVRSKEQPGQRLFLLDEIFRGTNTAERVAAGYAVLKHLNEGDDLVVVATHDVEVLGLLERTYASYHFSEQVTHEALCFDYRIRTGPSSTRNAIALLEFMRYPEQLIADALSALEVRG